MSRKTRPAKQSPKPTANTESSAAPTKQEPPMPTPSTSTPPVAAAVTAPAATFNGVVLTPRSPNAQEIPQPMHSPPPASSSDNTPAQAPAPAPAPVTAQQAQPHTEQSVQPPAAAAANPTTAEATATTPAWPPAIVLPLGTAIPDRAPSSPHSLSLSLNGDRRRKLHALRKTLCDRKATIRTRRGSAEGEQLVLTFNDTLLWLLDQVQTSDLAGMAE